MLGQKNWLVILLKPHELVLMPGGAGSPVTLAFPPAAVSNLEIFDRDALYALIASWAKGRPYQTTELIWLLAPSVLFEQTFPDSEKDRWDTMTVQFLDTVPFESVLSRVFNPVEGRHVVAANQDLVSGLIQGFAMQGYTTRLVVPAKLVGADLTLTPEIARRAVSGFNQLLRENLIIPASDNETPPQPQSQNSSPPHPVKPKSSLPLLLGIFGVLLAILVIVLLLNQS